jgi:hypothetical protein
MKLRLTIRFPDWLDKFFTFPLLTYRRLRFGHPFRKIRLTEGKFTIVDPDVFYQFNAFDWLTAGRDDNLYAARVIRSKTGRLNTIYMHREIFFTLSEHSESNGLVDHKNTNSLDNRRQNLRLATHSQNSCNTRRDKSNTYSRYRGVSFSKRKSKWFSAIRANGRKLWLGYFNNEIDAAVAYDEAARKYHKDFAQLNFPEQIANNSENTGINCKLCEG